MVSELPVLVVGGGPSGLTMALCLAKHGVPVRIVDASNEYHKGSRGAGLMVSLEYFWVNNRQSHLSILEPRTLEVFGLLGIQHQVHENRGAKRGSTHFYKYPKTDEVASIDANPLMPSLSPTPDRPFRSMWSVPQFRLEAVLRAELHKYGVHVELNRKLVDFQQTESKVVAQILHSENGETFVEDFQASYLVGADGAKGVVRKLLKLDFLGKTIDADGMLVADLCAHVWKLPNGLFFSVRPQERETNTFAMAILGPGSILQGQDSPANIRALFLTHVMREDIVLQDFHWYSFFKPNMRMVNKFSEGRGFVVGDAAHIHSPHGGQGLNTSVQDSFNLGWKMALAWHGLASGSLLDTYNEERQPVVAEMLRKVIGLYKEFTENAQKALSAAAHPIDLFQLDINYRWSSIIVEDLNPQITPVNELKAHAYSGWKSSLCAGDRAPDACELVVLPAAATSSSTLFNGVFSSTKHTILIFGNIVPFSSLDTYIADLPSDTVHTFAISRANNVTEIPNMTLVYDQGGHAFSAYGIDLNLNTSVAVVVRPDGYIGCITQSGLGIKKYLSLIFSK
ncbi:hypothetical protein D9757_009760 [Collybiopsis confluens]|uniref:FAD-binding domain-containing protein n=1 Tax=Collybiopsis confluens TaxID=2823264 RepID=A0A8H5LX88_9AGAR|nr:hypothetical protein D9757_009760 [Collybiopsis confluens]